MNSFLRKLIEEVGETPIDVDVLNFKKVADGEEVIGQIADNFTQRLIATRNAMIKEGEMIISSESPEDDAKTKLSSISKKIKILDEIFWASVREEVPGAEDSIGIRKEWQVVAIKEEPPRCAHGAASHVGIIVVE